ncbi:Mitogen-activated protein kinase kinase kinase YODA [Platanthera zijinensis]|uniref:mitogen-activated protein kinase kinase kinase n=1 Tax=Platanthera zijinensis TaxID=2320716 RepID=A0AAP0BXM0_9ASPA
MGFWWEGEVQRLSPVIAAVSRSSAPMKTTRGRHVSPEPSRHQHSEGRRRFSCSPVVEHPRHCESSLSPKDAIFNPRAVSFAPGSRGSPCSSSPTHPVSLSVRSGSPSGRKEDLKSPPHPLPLPPTSPSSPSSSSSSFASSSSHARWKKGKLLGRGTFGHVYLGFNSENGQMCAIKEVKAISDDSISRESLKQLNQEIQLLSQLSHPNVVQYYGSELVGETLAVYLEYVSGGSIHKLLQEYGPFGEPIIKNYTAQILSGLAYLHCRKTVHRDIKGANILVDPNGEVKLADFGMAKHVSSYTSIKSFKGSPYWMAPEVIMNVSGYNLSVDIWSLGCTVLEMATSKPPWSQFEGVAAIFKIGNSKDIPDIPEHLSSEAKSFLRLCLLRDPSSRPTATQLMNHPFIYDQHAIKATKSGMRKDRFPSSSDGSYSMNKGFHIHRSVSPVHEKDYELGHQVSAPIAHKDSSDLTGMRMNMSLPVSRCTSPLRQFRQANRSCFPSPTHPAFSADLGTQAQHHRLRR